MELKLEWKIGSVGSMIAVGLAPTALTLCRFYLPCMGMAVNCLPNLYAHPTWHFLMLSTFMRVVFLPNLYAHPTWHFVKRSTYMGVVFLPYLYAHPMWHFLMLSTSWGIVFYPNLYAHMTLFNVKSLYGISFLTKPLCPMTLFNAKYLLKIYRCVQIPQTLWDMERAVRPHFFRGTLT